jgi:uncharacterized protein (DUF433 family)
MVAPINKVLKRANPLTSEDFVGDLVPPNHPLFDIVWVNPERMSGTPCFTGTRVPIKSLFDHLEAGDALDVFLDDFPGVTREQAIALLEFSKSRTLDELVRR